MVSLTKLDKEKTFFYVFWFDDSDRAFVSAVDPISNAQAKRSGGCRCSGCRGVFFKERGDSWMLSANKVMQWTSSNEIMCHGCMIEEAETLPGPRGRLTRTAHGMLFHVKDKADLLLQLTLWKSGHRGLKIVRTKYGQVAVLNKRVPQAEDYIIPCPHCKRGISLAVAAGEPAKNNP